MTVPARAARAPRIATVLGVATFAVVWVVGALVMAGDDELSTTVGDQLGAQFPPGTITPGRTEDEIVCGDYVAPRLDFEEQGQHAADFACMRDALDQGRPAVLVRRDRTAAGYPVRVQVRVLAEDRLELVYDNTRDPTADFALQRSVCTGVDPETNRPTGCEVVETQPTGG